MLARQAMLHPNIHQTGTNASTPKHYKWVQRRLEDATRDRRHMLSFTQQ